MINQYKNQLTIVATEQLIGSIQAVGEEVTLPTVQDTASISAHVLSEIAHVIAGKDGDSYSYRNITGE